MKRILVILGNYSSKPSSVANCIRPHIDKLIQRGFKVDLVTNRRYINEINSDITESINIYRVNDSRALFLNTLNEMIKIDKGFIKVLTNLFFYSIKICYRLRTKYTQKDLRYGGWDVNSTTEKCMELLEAHDYDAVLSISQPFTSHLIAENVIKRTKKPLKWFVFQFDPFSYNSELISNKYETINAYNQEYRIFSKSDVILLTPELHKFYLSNPFSVFRSKMIPIPYANIEKISFDNSKAKEISFQTEGINCFFAGRLYQDIGNPGVALDIFSKIGSDITLTLMTNFREKQNNYPDNIKFIPFQNRDTALKMMLESNILVNIGNTVEMQVPGKLFEYISTGKPIIHFSKIKNDPALIYLKGYPNVFIVNEWENYTNIDIEKIKKFCYENKNEQYSFQEVSNIMHKYVGDRVSDDFVDTLSSYLMGDTNTNE